MLGRLAVAGVLSLALVVPGVAQTGGTGNAQTAPLTPVAPAAATAVKGWLFGLQYNSTQPTFTNGQQGSAQGTARGAVIVAPGVEGFAVTCSSGCSAGTSANNADGVAAVSTGLSQMQGYPFLYNGTTFDRWKGDATNGAYVNIKSSVSLAVTGTFWQATQPVSIATAPVLVAGSAIIGKVTTDQTTHGTTDLVAADITKVAGASVATGHGTASGALRVELPTDGTGVVGLAAGSAVIGHVITDAGSAIIGKVGVDQTTPGTTNAVAPIAGQNGVAGNTGTVGATTQRVTLATDVALPTGSNTIGNVGLTTQGYTASASITRTNDTNAYAANDVIGAATGSTAAVQFSSIGASGGDIVVTSVELEIDAAAIISGETSYNLYLYNVTPPSALGDNAAFDIPSGDRASFVGKIALGTPVDEGSTLYIRSDGVNAHVKLSSANLFGYLVTVGAYTPTASRVHKITLHAVGL